MIDLIKNFKVYLIDFGPLPVHHILPIKFQDLEKVLKIFLEYITFIDFVMSNLKY